LNTETAILIFTQELSKDAALKTLTPTKNLGLNKNLFQKLNQRINHVAFETNLPVFRSSDFGKLAGSYGEQLTNAIEKVFSQGFEKIICLGNDCPALGKVQILEAANQLQKSDTVIGPDQHGGVYLLGISKSSFDAEAFKKLAWKTDKMLESYLAAFENQTIFSLETIADIHTFQQLITYNYSNYFVKYLLQIIQKSLFQKIHFMFYSVYNQIDRYYSLRAPPVL
jgi:uncharacterized protein